MTQFKSINISIILLVTVILTSCNGQVKTDTLKFTSGIRAIYQDSKGNFWFGSLQEGVAVYNGTSFLYFTSDDGLSDNQIHNIQEDKKGIIWFNTQSGISSYDGKNS
jgi:ligand-binding sensor domain-containing protein